MEAFAISLYSFCGLFAAPVFCFLAAKWVRRFQIVSIRVWYASMAALLLILLEVGLVWTLGSVELRRMMGPPFDFVHSTAMLLAAPALACALILGRRHVARWWPLVAILCWCVGVAGILCQYAVMETR